MQSALTPLLANPQGAEALDETIKDDLKRLMGAHYCFLAARNHEARMQCQEIIDRHLRQMLQECLRATGY